jgi:hypothetical protein
LTFLRVVKHPLHGVNIARSSPSAIAKLRAAVRENNNLLVFFIPFGSGQQENFEFSLKFTPRVSKILLIEISIKGNRYEITHPGNKTTSC